MKIFLFLSLAIVMCGVVMNGCTISTSTSTPSYPELISVHSTSTTSSDQNYLSESYQGKIKEFLMGNSKDHGVFPPPKGYKGMGDIFKENILAANTEDRINFNYTTTPRHCIATSTPDKFDRFYCLNNDTYSFEDEKGHDEGMGAIMDLMHNGKKKVTGICNNSIGESLQDVRIVEGRIAFTFWQDCNRQNPANVQAKENIYYEGQTFNEKYNVQGSHYLFSYQGKLGFVADKDKKEYLFFNGKIISPGYDQILTYGCCMNPHYLEVFKNGKVDFMAIKDEKDYLVEIDLNDYVK